MFEIVPLQRSSEITLQRVRPVFDITEPNCCIRKAKVTSHSCDITSESRKPSPNKYLSPRSLKERVRGLAEDLLWCHLTTA